MNILRFFLLNALVGIPVWLITSYASYYWTKHKLKDDQAMADGINDTIKQSDGMVEDVLDTDLTPKRKRILYAFNFITMLLFWEIELPIRITWMMINTRRNHELYEYSRSLRREGMSPDDRNESGQ